MLFGTIQVGAYIGIGVAAAVVIFFLALILRTASYKKAKDRPQLRQDADISQDAASQHLQEAIRFATVSMVDEYKDNSAPFLAFRQWMLDTYPLFTGAAEMTVIADYSLIFHLKGSNPSLKGACFLSHQDVVPAPLDGWTHHPFGGELAEDGYIYGRGALDMKCHLVTLLEALEYLMAHGTTFERDIYVCFGHDEEPGQSFDGAPNIVKYLKEKGIEMEFVLDEGGTAIEGKTLFAEGLVAMVGAAEKGNGDLEIVVHGQGGHASSPRFPSANGRLATVIKKIERQYMHSRITPLTRKTFLALAPYTNPLFKFFMINSDVFSPVFRFVLGKAATVTNAMIRTTLAPTMLWGPDARNVLPREVKLNINYRTLTGDTAEDVKRHLERMLRSYIKKGIVSINMLGFSDPSRVADVESDAYRTLSYSIQQTFPDVAVVPYTMVGATDSRFYYPLTDNVYRFGPFVWGFDDESRVHGLDERIRPEQLGRAVQFFVNFIRNSCAQ
jgi:carboxypeptidase PM20D1